MPEIADAEPPRLIASYGRRRGRRLRETKRQLVDTLLPTLQVVLPASGTLQLHALFAQPVNGVWLEIGFGGGEHLAHQAALHPEIGFIGCEPYINGVSNLLGLVDAHPASDALQKHLRIYQGDVRALLARLPDACLDKVFILFPDPWPKARHHKRRLIQQAFLNTLARVMKPGAVLQLATDHEDYLTWMLEQLLASPCFTWTARQSADWLNPPPDWVETKYQQKATAEGRGATFLRFQRCTWPSP